MAAVKSGDVVAWREALTRLADQHFFDLIRMYLGAVKTPFNKQRLIEDLSAFLRKADNRAAIIDGLDALDAQILSAVVELPQATQQKLVSLFSASRSFPEIYERMLNLEERLIVYRRGDSTTREYAINPLLAEDLAPLLGMARLAGPTDRGEPVMGPARVDDLTLAAIYCFFLQGGEPVKNDGSLRKKTLETIAGAFPQLSAHADCLRILVGALRNLGLLVPTDGLLVPDRAKWDSFALLSPSERVAYLAAAAVGRAPRDVLRRRAQLFVEFVGSLDPRGRYDRETVSRLAYVLSERRGEELSGRAHGRFAAMLRDRSDREEASMDGQGADFADVAIAFGIVLETDSGLARNAASALSAGARSAEPFIVVSPSYSVTVMPGFGLRDLLPLVSCLEVRDVQIAGQFELTKRACSSAFDCGLTAETVTETLRKWSRSDVPQSVLFSVGDWYRGYASISLYHGYVLRIEEGRRAAFENDARLSTIIRKTLAPGVYLLDVAGPEEIQAAFADAGLDAAPAVSAPSRSADSLPLSSLTLVPLADAPSPGNGASRADESARRAHDPSAFAARQASLYASLEALALPADVADALKSRIDRRIVLVPAQLDPASVRVEKVEARDMDFLGKVRIAEYAITSGSLLEITLDERDGGRVILGRPVSCEKRTGDVLLKISVEPDHAIEMISLSRAPLVRRIRGSIFSELTRQEK